MRQYYRAVRDIARLANRRLDRFESKGSRLFSNFRDRTRGFPTPISPCCTARCFSARR